MRTCTTACGVRTAARIVRIVDAGVHLVDPGDERALRDELIRLSVADVEAP